MSEEPEIETGAETDPEKEVRSAQGQALRLLAHRSRSQAEVTRRLHEKGFSDEVVATVVERLCRARLLDDRQFASELFEHLTGRNWGRHGVLHKLREAGVSRELAEEVVQERLSPEMELELARRVVERLTPRLIGVEALARKRRTHDHLARHGFSQSVIGAVVAEEPLQ